MLADLKKDDESGRLGFCWEAAPQKHPSEIKRGRNMVLLFKETAVLL
jgi:hypothetical protein